MHHPSPSSSVLTESVTFSPGPAPVTARTDTSYTVLITSPVKWKEFWSASAGLVMLCIPEWLLLAKKICSGVQRKLVERLLHSVFHATKQRQLVTCTCRTKCHNGPVQDYMPRHTQTSYRNNCPLKKSGLVQETLMLWEEVTSSAKLRGARGAV